MIQLNFDSRWQQNSKITLVQIKFKLNFANRRTISSVGVYVNGGNKIKGQTGALKHGLTNFPRGIRTKIYKYYFANQSNRTRQLIALN